MYYVISGYCGPDCYTSDDGPVLKLTKCKTVEEVLKLRAEFEEAYHSRHTSKHVFRVIEGHERALVPKTVTTQWEIGGCI